MDQPYDKSTYQILRPVCTQDIVVSINKFGVAVGANQVPKYRCMLPYGGFKLGKTEVVYNIPCDLEIILFDSHGSGEQQVQGPRQFDLPGGHPSKGRFSLLVGISAQEPPPIDTTMYDAKSWPEITEHHRYLPTHPQAFGLMFVLFSEVFAGVFGT
ncbi:hypothetical protein SERLA73DRAFT_154422 [Serpula lacrymans var. lacrymans S7.3]|uniref:Uncharacterized protein n=1 Tax=Serpula lacrymans var. lacrymans (strain S7.3) TaxID=936435 RepID=F8Q5P0_SERL3|nr:hypothetical protein SERLA73DRAFT_154422 [Serpula lacrymans var. lacrymans S7.3]